MWTGGYVQLRDKRDIKGTRSCCPTFGGYVVGKAMVSCCAFDSHGQSMLACLTLDSGKHLKHLEIRIWVSPSKHARSSEFCDTWGFLLSFLDDLFFEAALMCYFDISNKNCDQPLGRERCRASTYSGAASSARLESSKKFPKFHPGRENCHPSHRVGVGWFITFSSYFLPKSESVGHLVS